MDSATEEEKIRLESLAKKTAFNNLEYFDCTYDRHKDLYGFRYENFAKSYDPDETPLNYAQDPDWSVKYHNKRINLKKYFVMLVIFMIWAKYKMKQVEKFDHLKRKEQRAMLNKEVDEFKDKKLTYVLFKPDGSLYEQTPFTYQILWLDSKMKNYELLLAYIKKKRIVRAQIDSALVVEQEEHMTGVIDIWTKQPVESATVLLRRPLSKQE